MAAAATLNTVTQEIKEGNSENAKWHNEERARQAAHDAILANTSTVTGGWLGKIFGGQDKARKEAAEAAREAARANKGGGSPSSPDSKPGPSLSGGGKIGRMMGGLFKFFGGLIGTVGKFAVMLLKPLVWLAKIPLMLASVTALWVGLAAVVGFFAAVTVASMSMSQKDFDALKLNIADGVAGAISTTVTAAMNMWNSFVPASWKISEDDKKKFSEATFKNVSEVIVSTIEFVEGISKAFDAGFQSQIQGFGASWESFKEVFDKIVKVFEGSTEGTGDAVEGGLKAAAETVGATIVKVGKFFLDLATALGTEAIGEDAKTDNALINGAAKIIVKIIKFIGNIVASFAGGFMENFDGIAAQFTLFKEKIGLLADKIGGWFTTLGKSDTEKSEKTILGVFSLLGKGLAKFYESIFKVLNFVADLILDPTVTLAKSQVAVEDAFNSMGRNIADFLDNIFNMESLMKMIQGVLGKDSNAFAVIEGFMGTVEENAKERQNEMEADKERLKSRSAMLAASAKDTEKQLKKQLALGDKRDDEKVRNLQLALSREQSEMERNKAGIERIEDNIKASKELIIQEKVDEKMGKAARAQEKKNAGLKEKIAKMEEGTFREMVGKGTRKRAVSKMGLKGLQEEEIEADISGFNIDFTLKKFGEMSERILEMSKGKITAEQVATGQAKLTPEMIAQFTKEFGIKKGDLGKKDQSIIFKAGLDRLAEIETRKGEIEAEKLKLAETDSALLKQRKETEKTVRLEMDTKHSGGIIRNDGMIYAQEGEIVVDDIFVARLEKTVQVISGLNLMNLQRESLAGKWAGSSSMTVVNNSSQQINQSRPMILPPSPIIAQNYENMRVPSALVSVRG